MSQSQQQSQQQPQQQSQPQQTAGVPAVTATAGQVSASSTPQPVYTIPAAVTSVGSSSNAATTTTTTAQGASQSTSSGQPGATQSGASGSGLQSSRLAAEQARKDRTLAEFMLLLDEHEPLIPTEVTDYFLQRAGFECEDVRLKRLVALAAQKFVSDISADAYQHARIRTNAAASGRGRAPLGQSSRDKTRTTLTMEDLSAALAEYGINARKPEFYM